VTGDGLSLYGVPGAFESGTQLVEIRARMAGHSDFERCERLVDAALAIMARCLPWLTDEGASDLCCATYLKTDSISQNVAYASPARLADEVRTAAGMFDAADMPAIAAFAFACAAHALRALEDWLQDAAGDELDGVGLFRAYMAEIDGCVSSAAIGLSPDEDDECNALGTAAAYASNLAADKANGLLSAIARRGRDGTEERESSDSHQSLRAAYERHQAAQPNRQTSPMAGTRNRRGPDKAGYEGRPSAKTALALA